MHQINCHRVYFYVAYKDIRIYWMVELYWSKTFFGIISNTVYMGKGETDRIRKKKNEMWKNVYMMVKNCLICNNLYPSRNIFFKMHRKESDRKFVLSRQETFRNCQFCDSLPYLKILQYCIKCFCIFFWNSKPESLESNTFKI